MADYIGTYRSSYFQVTDEEAYESLKHHIIAEDIEFWDKEKDGKIYHGFGGYGSIIGSVDDLRAYEEGESNETPDYDLFTEKLSDIIQKGSACVIMAVGHEKLRYVMGDLTVITSGCVDYDSLESRARYVLEKKGINPDSVDMYY